jgi:hypothetical protein
VWQQGQVRRRAEFRADGQQVATFGASKFHNTFPPGEMGRQIRLPERIAGIGNLRAFGMADARVDGIDVFHGALHAFRLVGQQFRVTRERIRQIEAKALRKMRHPTRLKQLHGFLDMENLDLD